MVKPRKTNIQPDTTKYKMEEPVGFAVEQIPAMLKYSYARYHLLLR
jgi:hypothetical protein